LLNLKDMACSMTYGYVLCAIYISEFDTKNAAGYFIGKDNHAREIYYNKATNISKLFLLECTNLENKLRLESQVPMSRKNKYNT